MSVFLSGKYAMLEWQNTCDFADIIYQTGYKQRLFIDTDTVRPVYEIKEEGIEDGEKNFIRTFTRVQKNYKCDFLAVEWMVDALNLMCVHDTKWLYLKNGEAAEIKDVTMDVEWTSAGIAKVTLTFITSYDLKSSCCGNMELIPCLEITKPAVKGSIDIADPEYIDPVNNGVKQGYRYFVTNSDNGTSGIYTYSTKYGWVEDEATEGDVSYSEENDMFYYYSNNNWNAFPSIDDRIPIPTDDAIKINGFCPPNTFVEISYKKSTDSNFIIYETMKSDKFNAAGSTISGLDADTSYDIKIRCYTHGCNYGYSETVTVSTQPET